MVRLPVKLTRGTIKEYNRNTLLNRTRKICVRIIVIILLFYLVYRIIPNPYLCYGYDPKKIDNIIEFDWTGDSYQCRFDIANSGVLPVNNPILHLYFIDGATVRLDPQSNEWQKNDETNYFWTKKIDILGGIHTRDLAERARPINVMFDKKGINRIEYVITSYGIAIQKRGIMKVINKH